MKTPSSWLNRSRTSQHNRFFRCLPRQNHVAMAMTAKKAYAHGMGPFPDGIYRAEFPYLYRAPKGYSRGEAIDYYVKKLEGVFDEASPAEHVAAIVVEPVQGEGGFVPAPIEWVKAVSASR